MQPTPSNTTRSLLQAESRPPRRRRWPWVVSIFLAPFVLLGLMAASYLSLEREAGVLRRHVMDATSSRWKTKVQISAGGLTLGAVRAGLAFVRHADAEKARHALRAVTRASVGVYRRDAAGSRVALERLLFEADRGMQQRGWTRVIGFSGAGERVLAYESGEMDADGSIEFCLAVLKDRELVVVSARLDADALADFVQQHLPEELSRTLHRQQTARHGAGDQ